MSQMDLASSWYRSRAAWPFLTSLSGKKRSRRYRVFRWSRELLCWSTVFGCKTFSHGLPTSELQALALDNKIDCIGTKDRGIYRSDANFRVDS